MREIRRLGPICREALKRIDVKFSGIVCIDKIWFRKVKGIWYYGATAVDARYGRVIYEHTYYANTPKAVEKYGELKGEDIVKTKTEAIERFLKELSEIITPKVIITDDNSSYDELIKEIFPKAKHFLCTFHIILNIRKTFKVPRNFKLSTKFKEFKKQLLDVFDLKKTNDLAEAERKLKGVLARERDFIGTEVETLLKSLRKNRNRLFPFLKYGINRTNNPVEFYFNFVKKFQKLARKFSSLEGIKCLLSVYALYYNFMPKMEGKNKGKSNRRQLKTLSYIYQ
jgi:transposase-like protein